MVSIAPFSNITNFFSLVFEVFPESFCNQHSFCAQFLLLAVDFINILHFLPVLSNFIKKRPGVFCATFWPVEFIVWRLFLVGLTSTCFNLWGQFMLVLSEDASEFGAPIVDHPKQRNNKAEPKHFVALIMVMMALG